MNQGQDFKEVPTIRRRYYAPVCRVARAAILAGPLVRAQYGWASKSGRLFGVALVAMLVMRGEAKIVGGKVLADEIRTDDFWCPRTKQKNRRR